MSFRERWSALRNAASARLALPGARSRYRGVADRWRREFPSPHLSELQSQLATHDQIYSAEYERWSDRLKLPRIRHRKYWEYAFIMEALEQRGLIAEGRRGLGFGVGKEPLASYLAAHGCAVLATDLASEQAVAKGWRDSNEHAKTFEELNSFGICEPSVFAKNVTFRSVDMTDIPSDLRGFDFTWSSCAFEHLGSIERGLAFVENSIDTLRPGGCAVHTTEFNLSSNDETLEHVDTVIFRRRDIERLTERLRAKGHAVAPLNFHPGDGELDRYIDAPPYTHENHVKLLLNRYVTTSFGIVVVAAGPKQQA